MLFVRDFNPGKFNQGGVSVPQSYLTLCDPVDCSLPGSSIHGILQARILEWVAISPSRGSSPTQGWDPGFLLCRQILHYLTAQVSPQQSK